MDSFFLQASTEDGFTEWLRCTVTVDSTNNAHTHKKNAFTVDHLLWKPRFEEKKRSETAIADRNDDDHVPPVANAIADRSFIPDDQRRNVVETIQSLVDF